MSVDPEVYAIITDYEFTRPCGDWNGTFNLWDDDVDEIVKRLATGGYKIVRSEP